MRGTEVLRKCRCIIVVWMLAVLYTMAQSPTKQGLHDRYARTILVKARRRR